ncbi:uncharacterized protein DUF5117 [Ulvibacter sp. MAR_2010_11]|uniref:zinc-dependent metalloprotease n=1 Tax=Ulvibacter sp. MAR_2010_11 TaxID=1250229 RepID=UPI000C2CAF28|nr:zinc-dependent metalloprotease [Ulvibacter sp. MAR_2010_11]PKA84027.1 uncharacterized protein DUF5117 [Ulvibacter sp. MAR_2010_11]
MRYVTFILVVFFGITTVTAQFLEKKKNLQKFEGFFNFHYAEAEGSIFLEVDTLDEEFLYVHSLRTGLGSNDIGLDRGQLGGGELVKFVKAGNKLLLIQPNMQYRANTDNQLEKKSITEAFAQSVLFGFEIKETKGKTHIIDLTPFLLLDAHGIAENLKKGKEGTYKLDKDRNALWMERTKAFPKNVEFEAMLTFVGESTGPNLPTVAPNANSVSVIQHHSFVELPKNNYKPRAFDSRCGSYPMTYMDYSTPIWEPITKRFITRHHLEKKNPALAKSEAVEPIIYYLDPGTPEPVRSALLEGARWWNEAFEAIGYTNAFQVKLLPEDADPMDVRYNLIQWVHRSTRGWSYGSTINDPRTGEIIKGHVSLGSLRIRQDFMIAQALMNKPFAERDDNHDQMLSMALARIRQLSAHEVGHTLGFAHNFAASTTSRASVMDYPHPTLTLRNGEVDFSSAYATGIGEWDKVTVAYSYSDLPAAADEKTALNAILETAFANGMQFISDSDARAQDGAHVNAHLWDNGKNASEELEALLQLREKAIANFSEDNIRKGEPYSVLEDVFVPLYFYHRFQTEAAVKLIGGLNYNYATKGNPGTVVQTLPKQQQTAALRAVLKTLEAKSLAIPEDKLKLFPPRAYSYSRSRESFKSNMGVAFDALGAAATAGEMTLELLLHPERANRLVQQKAVDAQNIGLEEVLEQLIETTFEASVASDYEKEVQHAVQFETLQYIIRLVLSKKAIPQTKGIANTTIDHLESLLSKKKDNFSKQLLREITTFREDPLEFEVIAAPAIPDGSPIGSFQCFSIKS